jgi:three-Cys-motif partner protein
MADEQHGRPAIPEVGPWAKAKLDILGSYLNAYTTVFQGVNRKRVKQRRTPFKTVYVDAFAGAGTARIRRGERTVSDPATLALVETVRDQDPGVQLVIAGSPRRALEVAHPFDRYVFVEQAPDRLALLNELATEFGERLGPDRVVVRAGDCNTYLLNHLLDPRRDWNVWKGLVFLDPFGMDVPWETVVRLSATNSIEVFINFPLHMCIQRFMRRNPDEITPGEYDRLDRYFGGRGWFEQAYERRTNLFNASEVVKREDANERLLTWYRERLALNFGHVSPPGLINNTVGGPLYYLIHAGPNATGSKIASAVLERPVKAGRR